MSEKNVCLIEQKKKKTGFNGRKNVENDDDAECRVPNEAPPCRASVR